MGEIKIKDSWDNFLNFVKDNGKGSEVAILGLCGILAASYKTKVFTRFTNPHKVPKSFFKKKVQMEGVVVDIEPGTQPYILVDHKPVIPLPRLRQSNKYLPLKIVGVNVTGNGISWLQTVLKGQKISFIPVDKSNDCLSCIIKVQEGNKGSMLVGRELAKLGFATIQEFQPLTKVDKEIKSYKTSLKSAQKWSQRKRNGIWQSIYPPTLMWKLKMKLDSKLNSILPVYISRYLNL